MRETMPLLLLLVAFLAPPFAKAHAFTPCKVPANDWGLATITLTPDEPKPGSDIVVNFSGTAKKDLGEGEYLTLNAKVFGVSITKYSFNFCDDLGLTCPVKAGASYKGVVKHSIPAAAPGGVKAEAEIVLCSDPDDHNHCISGQAKKINGCADFELTLGKKTFSDETNDDSMLRGAVTKVAGVPLIEVS